MPIVAICQSTDLVIVLKGDRSGSYHEDGPEKTRFGRNCSFSLFKTVNLVSMVPRYKWSNLQEIGPGDQIRSPTAYDARSKNESKKRKEKKKKNIRDTSSLRWQPLGSFLSFLFKKIKTHA